MRKGNLQRRWSETKPEVYDKNTRKVSMDIKPEQRTDEKGDAIDGYSFLEVELDPVMDYGHVKSQLIEAGFGQKDEFGLLMNAVESIINATDAESWEAFKQALNTDDITAFREFCEFRAMCALSAKVVMNNY